MTEQPSCPQPPALKALLDGVLSLVEENALSAHLEQCVRCQETLQRLVASEASWAGLLRWLEPTPPVDTALQEAMAQSIRSHGIGRDVARDAGWRRTDS